MCPQKTDPARRRAPNKQLFEFLFEAKDRLQAVRWRLTQTAAINPIAAIAECFGSPLEMANELGYPQQTVTDWIAAGRVPSSRIPEVIARAAKVGIRLTPCSFFGGGECGCENPTATYLLRHPTTGGEKVRSLQMGLRTRFPFDDPASLASAEESLNPDDFALWQADRDVWLGSLASCRAEANRAAGFVTEDAP